ncbi:D-galactonate transporter [Pantoea sp. AS-PWVM4]|uniref:MFS transporter n=1 Tax=Pantoea sp. AS-PWVM4 TaxID=1332069 RepID=UPI0003AC69DA|nr:MFS transporter [Pantoea sp. AS-PWVM4]ERK12350.1 D-galactonate transporter [Pantoea sp. AS-PWVM4]
MSLNSNGASAAVSARKGKFRFIILTVLSVSIAINYIDRAAMSVAIPFMSQELHFSPTDSGLLLSAFFWSYVLFQLPGGWLVDKLGPRITFALSSLGWGLATAACGLASSIAALVGFRFVLGAVEAPSYPASSSTVTRWFPRQERSFAAATFNNGSKIGGTLAIPIISFLIALVGWRMTFVISGLVAVVWALAWYLWYRDPREHKAVSAEEVAFIEANQDPQNGEPMSVRQLLAQRTVQAMMAGFFCINFVSYFFFTWFPTYLVETFHLSLMKFGLLGMLPGIAAIVGGWCGGLLSDSLVRRGYSLSVARKIPLVGGMLGSATIGLAAFSPTVGLALSALCFANFAATFASAALWALPSDVAPNRANVATIGGIQNMAANLAGIISPILIGVIMQFTHSFVIPLEIAGVIGVVGALVYAFWLPRVQPMGVADNAAPNGALRREV